MAVCDFFTVDAMLSAPVLGGSRFGELDIAPPSFGLGCHLCRGGPSGRAGHHVLRGRSVAAEQGLFLAVCRTVRRGVHAAVRRRGSGSTLRGEQITSSCAGSRAPPGTDP